MRFFVFALLCLLCAGKKIKGVKTMRAEEIVAAVEKAVEKGKYDEAASGLKELLRREPRNRNFQAHLGLMYHQRRMFGKAESVFRKCFEGAVDKEMWECAEKWCHMQSFEDLSTFDDVACDTAVRCNETIDNLINYGNYYYRKGNDEKAFWGLEKAFLLGDSYVDTETKDTFGETSGKALLIRLTFSALHVGECEKAVLYGDTLVEYFPKDTTGLYAAHLAHMVCRVGDEKARSLALKGNQIFAKETHGLGCKKYAFKSGPKEAAVNSKVLYTGGEKFGSFVEKQIRLYEFKDVRLVGNEGLVTTQAPDCTMHADSAGYLSKFFVDGTMRNDIGKLFEQPVPEPVMSVITNNPSNYATALLEIAGRLLLAEKHLLPKQTVKFIVSDYHKATYTQEIIKLLGMGNNEFYDKNDDRIFKTDQLFTIDWRLPAAVSKELVATDPWYPQYPPRHVLTSLRQELSRAPSYLSPSSRSWKVILLGKGTENRALTGELYSLKEELENLVGSAHFEHVESCKEMTVGEQIDLFANAALVISPQDTHLLNMLFMPKNGQVLILPIEPHTERLYHYAATALGLTLVEAEHVPTSKYYGSYNITKSHVESIVSATKTALEANGFTTRECVSGVCRQN